jgi:hypothetical protein
MLGNDSWYFVTPDGALYRNTGSTNLASNVKITQLDATFYANPALIHEAVASNVMLSQQTLTEIAQLELHYHMSYYENWGGWNEIWAYSNTKQWYFITADGMFYRWSGDDDLSLSTPIMNIGSRFYNDSTLLGGLNEFGSWAVSTASQLNQDLDLHLQSAYALNWGGANEKWIKGSGDTWYFITPNGGFYQWNGAANLRDSSLIATLDSNYYAVPSRLHEAPLLQPMMLSVVAQAIKQNDVEPASRATTVIQSGSANLGQINLQQQAIERTGSQSRVFSAKSTLLTYLRRTDSSTIEELSEKDVAAPSSERRDRMKAFDEFLPVTPIDLDALFDEIAADVGMS